MEKTFFEKMGDTLDHMGKRSLFGLAVMVVGILMIVLGNLTLSVAIIGVPLCYIGLVLFLGGFFTMLSIVEHTKTYYVTGISVRTPRGEEIPCTVVKQKKYADIPLVPIVCPFFYLPYQTKYGLILNMTAPNIAKGSKIKDEAFSYGYLNTEWMPKTKYQALLTNPQAFADEIAQSVHRSREMFCSNIRPYVNAKVLEEIYYTDRLSICRVPGETYVLFHYASMSGYQRGVVIVKESIEKIKADDSFLTAAYLCAQKVPSNVVELNPTTFEKMIRHAKQQDGGENHGDQ